MRTPSRFRRVPNLTILVDDNQEDMHINMAGI